jgi:hypothetical protein
MALKYHAIALLTAYLTNLRIFFKPASFFDNPLDYLPPIVADSDHHSSISPGLCNPPGPAPKNLWYDAFMVR